LKLASPPTASHPATITDSSSVESLIHRKVTHPFAPQDAALSEMRREYRGGSACMMFSILVKDLGITHNYL